MARSARSSTSAGVSSGRSNAAPADAETESATPACVAVVRATAASSDSALRSYVGLGQLPQQDGELIAAQPRHNVGGAHVPHEHHRHRLEHGVAGGMAVAIVDGLEVVEVEVDERRIRFIALGVVE